MVTTAERWRQDFLPNGWRATSATRLDGGMANDAWLVTLADRRKVVVKRRLGAPETLFPIEAAGLAALRDIGGLPTPDVLAVGPDSLVLRALNPRPPDSTQFWEDAGRAIARLHSVGSPRHGWHHDGWLGQLVQQNPWDEDGHRFFAQHRILRFLPEPGVRRALDDGDRARLHRLCDRLPDLIPASPAVLTHGDLWHANIIADAQNRPVFIDPAVSWTWAEVDISMMYCTGRVPDRFFDAYHEIYPAADGWRDRMELLNLRELLSVVAHFGPTGDYVERIRAVVRRFG